MLPHRLVYGYYPDIVNNPGNEKELLKQLSDSYLYKDVLLLDQIKRPDALVKLLQALAFQVGSQVSFSELAKLCGLDAKTIEKYIGILEQAYIIFRIGSFSRNLRSELKKSRKIYFYDNGIRNALIANFSQIENRTDIGALWENFLVAERIKYLSYNQQWVNYWYWRTKEQQEIDFLEEADGKLTAYEFKWNPLAKSKVPGSFKTAYPDATYHVVHRDNFESFLCI
jgi:predicted AAA+ superfamily ATPase